MSFLDSLEGNLKNLELHEEAGAGMAREQRRRELDRAMLLAAGENADRLKKSPYTAELLKHMTRMGHAMRTKVRMAWIGTTLRFDARERRLELRPGPDGITAAFFENASEIRSRPLDLAGNPEELAREWLRQP